MAPKVALVTGATGGIGKATSVALAKEGYTLALHYNSASKSTVDELLASVNDVYKATAAASSSSSSPNNNNNNNSSSSSISISESVTEQAVRAFQADLSDFEAVKRLHAQVVAELGDPAVVFLNAGTTAGVSGVQSISEIPLAAFEQTWRVNTAAPFLLAQLCLPAMERGGWGRVVFNSSVAGITGGVVGGHYASSKAALHGLVHWLAGSVAKKGVTVNAVAPALVEDTAMLPSGGEELARSESSPNVSSLSWRTT